MKFLCIIYAHMCLNGNTDLCPSVKKRFKNNNAFFAVTHMAAH